MGKHLSECSALGQAPNVGLQIIHFQHLQKSGAGALRMEYSGTPF